MQTKRTKYDCFVEIRQIIENSENTEMTSELLEFIDKQIDAIDKRRAYERNKAEKKRQESDALTDRIYATLGTELMTLNDISAALGNEAEITAGKISARLRKLINAGYAEAEQIKVDGKRKVAYRLKTEDGEAAEDNEE